MLSIIIIIIIIYPSLYKSTVSKGPVCRLNFQKALKGKVGGQGCFVRCYEMF